MHEPIRDRLEDVLDLARGGAESSSVEAHLSACAECSSEVVRMSRQAALIRGLKAPEEIEPSAGFYARVIQRIEERTKDSIWAVFIETAFGKRLALATMAAALLFGGYVVSVESQEEHLDEPTAMAPLRQAPTELRVVGDAAQQRDAVLVNFASYQGTGQ